MKIVFGNLLISYFFHKSKKKIHKTKTEFDCVTIWPNAFMKGNKKPDLN